MTMQISPVLISFFNISAVSTNGKIVTSLAAPVTASAGSASASVNTGTGTTADFYVFTTSTAAGTVAVTVGANTTTYYFNGTAGALNTIALSAPTSGAAGTVQTITVSGYDVFGNAKGGASISLQYITPTASTTYSQLKCSTGVVSKCRPFSSTFQ